MTGSTDTSLWTVYQKGVRNYCGNALPDGEVCFLQEVQFKLVSYFTDSISATGMVKNQKLRENIITPTTKAADHDVPITPEEVLNSLFF